MSQERYPARSSEPEQWDVFIAMTGTGNGTVPTKNRGRGVTLTWVSTGIITLTFADYPGVFLGGSPTWQATTASALKGFSVVFGAFDATGKIVNINITNASSTLVDLQVLQTLGLQLSFSSAGSAAAPI